MTTYNWQQKDWPHFRYDLSKIQEVLLSIAQKTGLISGKLTHLDKDLRMEAMINFMIEEAVKTSEIEGEYISRPDVRSSIKNKLGLNTTKARVNDKRAQGIVEMLLDARNTFKQSLTENKLHDWHLMLFASSTNHHLKIACWREHDEPMQIISNHRGKQVVHYEAPPSGQVPAEMAQFISWFNNTAPGKSQAIIYAPVRAAIAHLYFESIHPFEDGNGRIGRVIAEKALSQGFGYPLTLSLSQVIEANKKEYYQALHVASKSNEITEWIYYFVNMVLLGQAEVENQINFILKKSKFFDKYESLLNERELKAIQWMLKEGGKGFEGGMSAKKYMAITDTSKATATRDLQHLVRINALNSVGSGRNVRYELNL